MDNHMATTILITLALCSGCLSEEKKAGKSYTVIYEGRQTPEECTDFNSQRERDTCHLIFARTNRRPDLCARIVEERWRDQCYYKIAEETNATSLCKKILDAEQKDNCVKGLPYIHKSLQS
jgi:hypothetical protein